MSSIVGDGSSPRAGTRLGRERRSSGSWCGVQWCRGSPFIAARRAARRRCPGEVAPRPRVALRWCVAARAVRADALEARERTASGGAGVGQGGPEVWGFCGGGSRRCCFHGASASVRRRGSRVLAVRGRGEDKGGVGSLSGKDWRGGEATGDDHGVAALSGLCHADIGIVQSVPKPASTRLSSLGAPKQKKPFATR